MDGRIGYVQISHVVLNVRVIESDFGACCGAGDAGMKDERGVELTGRSPLETSDEWATGKSGCVQHFP